MKRLLLVAALALPSSHLYAQDQKGPADCKTNLIKDSFTERLNALKRLQVLLPKVLGEHIKEESWFKLLETYVNPSVGASPLLISTITGSGSGRKSAIFSAFESIFSGEPTVGLRNRWSPSSWKAGSTKQSVLLVGEARATTDAEQIKLADGELDARIPGIFQRPWAEGAALHEGTGVLARSPHLPPFFGVMDTPGFDTNSIDRETTARSLSSADVIVLAIAGMTMSNELNRDILRENFRLYGVRRIVVVVSDVFPGTPAEVEAARSIRALAQEIYHEQFSEEMPEGLLGVYMMPSTVEAGGGKAHVSIYPMLKVDAEMEHELKKRAEAGNESFDGLERFPEFKDLLNQMSAQRAEIKQYGLSKAMETIIAEASHQLKKRLQASLAAEVYIEAAQAWRDQSVRHAELNFAVKDTLETLALELRRYKGKGGGWEELFDILTQKPFAKVRSGISPLARAVWAKVASHDGEAAAPTSPTSEPVAIDLTQSMSDLHAPYKSLSLEGTYLMPQADNRATRRALAYNRVFNPAEEHGKLDVQKTVRLPAVSLFAPAVREAISKMIVDQSDLAKETKKSILQAVKDALNPVKNAAGIFQEKSPGEKILRRGLKSAYTLGMTAATGAAVVTGQLWVIPFKAAAGYLGVAGASNAHEFVERELMNQEALALIQIHAHFNMETHLLKKDQPLLNALRAQTDISEVVKEAQEVVKLLNPSFEILPITLDEFEEPAPLPTAPMPEPLYGLPENPVEELLR